MTWKTVAINNITTDYGLAKRTKYPLDPAALWILVGRGLSLDLVFVLRGKHRLEIRDTVMEVHPRRFKAGEISEDEFNRLKSSPTNN